jgi:hypothetical protein
MAFQDETGEDQIVTTPARKSRWFRIGKPRPGRVALLWFIGTLLCVVDIVLFPQEESDLSSVSQSLFFAGTPILAALIAASVLGARASALWLAARFAAIFIVTESCWLLIQLWAGLTGRELPTMWITYGALLILFGLTIWLGYAQLCNRKRRIAAILIALIVEIFGPAMAGMDTMFWHLSAQAQPLVNPTVAKEREEAESPLWNMDADRLWEAQPALIDTALGAMKPHVTGTTNIYGVAVAAQGSQTIFSREAHLALDVMAARFAPQFRGGVLLSNGEVDILHSPLATNGNIASVVRGISAKADADRDLAIVYLASHGGRNAELGTDLPDYQDVDAISSTALAAALDGAGIRRRVVIVSACFSATWIPALANDDTIVITAAAKDRTSFGCSDERRLTFFGQAFLEGPLAKGASLQDAFESAKRTVARWEKKEGAVPSLPQAYVGRNMTALWGEKRRR